MLKVLLSVGPRLHTAEHGPAGKLSASVLVLRSWVWVLLSVKSPGIAQEQAIYLNKRLGPLTEPEVSGAACKFE